MIVIQKMDILLYLYNSVLRSSFKSMILLLTSINTEHIITYVWHKFLNILMPGVFTEPAAIFDISA